MAQWLARLKEAALRSVSTGLLKSNDRSDPAAAEFRRFSERLLHRPVGNSPTQNQFVTDRATALQEQQAIDVRVNQQQVNVNGTRVGVNRPDLQYTLGDQRHYEEFDVPSSTRGPAHAVRIQANDPAGVVALFKVP